MAFTTPQFRNGESRTHEAAKNELPSLIEQIGGIADQLRHLLDDGSEHASTQRDNAASTLRTLGRQVSNVFQSARSESADRAQALRHRAESAANKGYDAVQEHPLQAIALAGAVGLLIGLVVSSLSAKR